jgi:hypothetical protein
MHTPEKMNQGGGDGLSKKQLALAIASGCALVAVAAFVLLTLLSGTTIDQTRYALAYMVSVDPKSGGLEVEMDFEVHKLSKDRMIYLYAGLGAQIVRACVDDTGAEIGYEIADDLIAVGPLGKDIKSLKISYYTDVGVTETDSAYERIDTFGCLFDDLLSFSGEYCLLTPFLDPDSFDSVRQYISDVLIEFAVPSGWQAIVPYHAPLDPDTTIRTNAPTWEFFNTISKSAFSFGYFERFDYGGTITGADVYIDSAVKESVNQYALDALYTFISHFEKVFGETLDEAPIVLLRSHPANGEAITGGVGAGGSAFSINISAPDDFKSLANVVFHTFFDAKVKPRNLRYTTCDWIYQGLANYYVDETAPLLPDYVRESYGINLGMTGSERYLRYLYFSLKEPGFLALTPNDESLMYDAQREFYHGVKVPLLIGAINYSIETRTGEADGFIRALVKRGDGEKPVDVRKLMNEICGADFNDIEGYLSGLALIPNYGGFSVDYLPPDDICYALDQDEQYYAYLFDVKNLFYPYMPVFLLEEQPFMEEVAGRGLRYNTDEIEAAVKAFSPELNRILLQYALWADIAGIKDVTTPNIMRTLSQPDIVEAYTVLCEEIGYEVAITSSMKG